jgi:hypothetical protein
MSRLPERLASAALVLSLLLSGCNAPKSSHPDANTCVSNSISLTVNPSWNIIPDPNNHTATFVNDPDGKNQQVEFSNSLSPIAWQNFLRALRKSTSDQPAQLNFTCNVGNNGISYQLESVTVGPDTFNTDSFETPPTPTPLPTAIDTPPATPEATATVALSTPQLTPSLQPDSPQSSCEKARPAKLVEFVSEYSNNGFAACLVNIDQRGDTNYFNPDGTKICCFDKSNFMIVATVPNMNSCVQGRNLFYDSLKITPTDRSRFVTDELNKVPPESRDFVSKLVATLTSAQESDPNLPGIGCQIQDSGRVVAYYYAQQPTTTP